MQREKSGLFLVLSAVFLWSTIEVASKYLAAVSPVVIAFVRFFLGALLLSPFWVFRMRDDAFRMSLVPFIPRLLLSSVVGITFTFTLFHYSLVFVSASIAATIISSVPLFILPLSFLLMHEKPDRRIVYGVLLGSAGMVVLLAGDAGSSEGIFLGAIFSLGAAFCFSIFTVWNKRLADAIKPEVATSLSLFFGSLLFIPVVYFSGSTLVISIGMWEWLVLIYLGLGATGAGYLLYFLGLQKMEIARGSSVFFVKPVIALFLAVLLINERPHLLSLLGIIIVVLSMNVLFPVKHRKRFYLGR